MILCATPYSFPLGKMEAVFEDVFCPFQLARPSISVMEYHERGNQKLVSEGPAQKKRDCETFLPMRVLEIEIQWLGLLIGVLWDGLVNVWAVRQLVFGIMVRDQGSTIVFDWEECMTEEFGSVVLGR